MTTNIIDPDSLSHSAQTIVLARIAHHLTVSARSTYVPGTEDLSEPGVLRAYNELLHRVTSALRSHVEGNPGMSLKAVLETMQEFANRFNRTGEIEWVLKSSTKRPLPTSH